MVLFHSRLSLSRKKNAEIGIKSKNKTKAWPRIKIKNANNSLLGLKTHSVKKHWEILRACPWFFARVRTSKCNREKPFFPSGLNVFARFRPLDRASLVQLRNWTGQAFWDRTGIQASSDWDSFWMVWRAWATYLRVAPEKISCLVVVVLSQKKTRKTDKF